MRLVSLKAELRQELKLTPQLLQSMEILQMNAQELLEYLGRAAEENPVLEQEDASSLYSAYEELRRRAGWIDGGVYGATFAHEEAAPAERGAVDRETESLTAFLADQLERRHLPKPLLALTKYLAELLDEDGYLAAEDLESVRELKIPPALIDRAVETLQSLDPAGVGARDLSECLLLQLARREDVSPAVLDITARFLPELSRKHYGPICRELGLTVEEVRAAGEVIAALDPHPGSSFQTAEETLYVRPDVFIVDGEAGLEVVLNEYYLPRISISSYYTRLLQESDEAETRAYLQQKLRQAKWLLTSLDRRGSTLTRCAQAVLDAQRPFFSGESDTLSPMGLAALARSLDLHPSTVSRAVRGKYLQCRRGTYPLRYFFSRPVGSQGASRQAVKLKLLALVKEEDPRHPLSDQQLCALLSQDGTEVARRTVTKYRLELGIASSTARKR
ncbi:MAG: RNA polymerase factor sigma-54 [Oscillibacter sp.]|nr:RNA polymerase factor sigma-54 [Oscillibacter sp.]